uniref:Uncharacterized protein n=1 Tax=Myotis myotis TaxID=51298 RepID=A0A7J7Z555_MYOMY|nr:hypothetical protein mMyoMyo1_010452 [Myotis myotis]
MQGPAQLPEELGSGEKRPEKDRGGEGGGRGVGDPEASAAWNLGGPGAEPGGCLATTCPDQTGFNLHLARSRLSCSRATVDLPALAAHLGSGSPASPPSAGSARRPPRSAQLGCWEYNGEQERPRPLFPLILQPSGWSPQPTDLPGKTKVFLMVGPSQGSLVD